MIIAGQRKRLLDQVPEAVRGVQARVFAETMRSPTLSWEPALYADPFIVRDLQRYRAARTALAFVEECVVGLNRRSDQLLVTDEIVTPTNHGLLDSLAKWPAFYSPDGKPYRSLNRTLANLPALRPAWLALALVNFRLAHPIFDRVVLTALFSRSMMSCDPNSATDECHIRILQAATRCEIESALLHVGDATGNCLSTSKHEDIKFVMQFLADCPEAHCGRLGGLIRKAIRWHREVPLRDANQVIADFDGRITMNTATVLPPIALPQFDGIRFLANVREIVEEGQRMRHCIANRIASAVSGKAYLFHVEHKGEHATYQVDAHGGISDGVGPANTENGASRWASGVFKAWGRTLYREAVKDLPTFGDSGFLGTYRPELPLGDVEEIGADFCDEPIGVRLDDEDSYVPYTIWLADYLYRPKPVHEVGREPNFENALAAISAVARRTAAREGDLEQCEDLAGWRDFLARRELCAILSEFPAHVDRQKLIDYYFGELDS